MHAPRKTHGTLARYLSSVLLPLGLLLFCCFQPGNAVGQVNSTVVDERLFLIGVLESLYDQWPLDVENSEEFAASAAALRNEAIKYRQHIEETGLDASVAQLFKDFINALDVYTNFLASIEKIQQDALVKAAKNQGDALATGGFAGGATFATLRNNEASGKEAMTAALLAGGVAYLFDSWQKSVELDEIKRRAVAAEAQRTSDLLVATLTRARRVSAELATRFKWQKSEVDFSSKERMEVELQEALQNNNIAEATRILDEHIKVRPRDFVLRLRRNVTRAEQEGATPASIVADAKDCIAAAALVPSPTIYDDCRDGCLLLAAIVAHQARYKEIELGTSPLGSTEISRFSVSLWKKVREVYPADPSGELRESYAAALLANAEVTEAQKQASEIFERRKESPDFCYLCACILSRSGEAEKSFLFFQQAIWLGFAAIEAATLDPDLAKMREVKGKAFDDLVSVKIGWSIQDGFLADTVKLTNNSAFVLTNVVVKLELIQNGKAWYPTFSEEAILPGQTCTWSTSVTIPASQLTKSSGTLSCDQTSVFTKFGSATR